MHAKEVDAWLGLRTQAVEDRLSGPNYLLQSKDVETWRGLPVQTMLTPYLEIRSLLEELQPSPGDQIVDLGAGYGRMGFVIGASYPEVRFLGYELVRERVEEAIRCLSKFHYPHVQMVCGDLAASDFQPAEAKYYFLYDYGTRAAIEKTLNDLRQIAQRAPITVIGRGRASRDAVERGHPWLSEIIAPRHFDRFSIYWSYWSGTCNT